MVQTLAPAPSPELMNQMISVPAELQVGPRFTENGYAFPPTEYGFPENAPTVEALGGAAVQTVIARARVKGVTYATREDVIYAYHNLTLMQNNEYHARKATDEDDDGDDA